MDDEKQDENKSIRIYQCEPSPEGILTAVYDAGKSRYGHKFIKLQIQFPDRYETRDLFSDYISVSPDKSKMERVLDAVYQKISPQAYEQIMRCVTSNAEDRANVAYHYVVYGFALGGKIINALQIPWVQRMFEINRMVLNEAHYFREFIRFQEVKKDPSLLLAVIEPSNEVLLYVTQHFADRLNAERFMIYDKSHRQASLYAPNSGWVVRYLEPQEEKRLQEMEKYQEKYTDLWKIFFETIAIDERKNPNLQRNMLPKHFRKHMPEFLERGHK